METGDLSFILATLGLLLTAASIAFAYIWYRRSLRVKKPCYAIESTSLARSSDIAEVEGIEANIKYKGRPVENLTSSKVAIFNDGRETIEGDDIPDADPIRIVSEEGYELVSAKIDKSTSPTNQAKCCLLDDNKTVTVSFDYLDYHDGFVVDVLHTGKSSWSIDVTGSVKGGGKIHHAASMDFPTRKVNIRARFWLFFIVAVSFAIGMLWVTGNTHILRERNFWGAILGIGALGHLLSPLLGLFAFRDASPPKELDVRDDDAHLRSPAPGLHYKRDKDHEPRF